MPHVLQYSQSLSGVGQNSDNINDGHILYLTVTTRGALVRELDTETSPRLAHVGWVSFNHGHPVTPSPDGFEDPIWIGFDNYFLNLIPRWQIPPGSLGATGVRWHMIAGSVVLVEVYTFS
jgi:hypothetical protein